MCVCVCVCVRDDSFFHFHNVSCSLWIFLQFDRFILQHRNRVVCECEWKWKRNGLWEKWALWEICPYCEVQMSECMCVRVQKSSLTSRTLTSLFFSVLQAMVETVNNLLQVRSQAAWRELSVAEQLRCATMLLDTVETGAFMLADNLLKTDTIQESTDNIREFTKQVLAHAKRMFTCKSLCTYFIVSYCLFWFLLSWGDKNKLNNRWIKPFYWIKKIWCFYAHEGNSYADS